MVHRRLERLSHVVENYDVGAIIVEVDAGPALPWFPQSPWDPDSSLIGATPVSSFMRGKCPGPVTVLGPKGAAPGAHAACTLGGCPTMPVVHREQGRWWGQERCSLSDPAQMQSALRRMRLQVHRAAKYWVWSGNGSSEIPRAQIECGLSGLAGRSFSPMQWLPVNCLMRHH